MHSHSPEEQPAGDETLVGPTRGLLHDVQIRGVEAQGSGGQTVGDLRAERETHALARPMQLASYALPLTRLTHSSWTGMRASGRPRAAVKKMDTTSPMFEEIR